MMKTIIFVAILLVAINAKYFSVIKGGDGKFSVVEGKAPNALAFADYEKEMNTKGWNKLFLKTLPSSGANDTELAFAAGYLEGSLDPLANWDSYLSNVASYKNNTPPVAELNFLTQNYLWTKDMATRKPEQVVYWRSVELVLRQLEGLLQGHNDHCTSDKKMTLMDLILINSDGDRITLDDIFLNGGLEESNPAKWHEKQRLSHCSSLIRLPEDRGDLFTSHTTWSGYNSMIRTYKVYDLQFSSSFSSRISFSSYPATLLSIDDFYVSEKGLSVIETTNSVMNKSLHDLVTPKSVLSWIRTIVATRMATTGYWWVDTFKLYNSGTYNNQWIVTDFKQYDPITRNLRPGALWIAEQIPGYIESQDMTSFLDKTGHWPSYNIPYFPYIYNVSGYPEYVKKYGNQYSYTECPRAKIFARDYKNVNTIDGMKWIMRYNDWQNDPLSLGNAGNAISSRFDLVANGRSAFGGIDTKVTSYKEYQKGMVVHAQSGPTYNQQVAFNWNTYFANTSHPGIPDLFIFSFHTYSFNE